jgi:predicted alpha-1,2-mannosidase
MDVDGMYRGLDQNDHKAAGFTNYTIFSLWDNYRALHPFFNLLQPKRNGDMVKSMMAHYDQSVHKMLPVWSHYANENWCMIGYHAVPVLVDTYIKGNIDSDPAKLLDAMVNTASNPRYDGTGHYMILGYVPEDKSGSSVSKTLEYAYDDWCIAEFAKKTGNQAVYEQFKARSENYRNVYLCGQGCRTGNGSLNLIHSARTTRDSSKAMPGTTACTYRTSLTSWSG